MDDPVDETYREMAETLTLFLGYHQLLIDETFGPLSRSQRKILKQLLRRSEQLREILRRRIRPTSAISGLDRGRP